MSTAKQTWKTENWKTPAFKWEREAGCQVGKAGGRGESEKNPRRRKRWGEKEEGADTLTDWLRSANTRCCLQLRLARGLGQHNLCVLDNLAASQLQLDAAPQQYNISLDISKKLTSPDLRATLTCVRVIERQTARPGIHGNPSQVHWFICNSGNSTYNEKHAYKVSGIQMHCVFPSSVFIESLSLSLSHSGRCHMASCSPTRADISHNAPLEWQVWYFQSGWLRTAFKIHRQRWKNTSDVLLMHSILQKTPKGTCYIHHLGSWLGWGHDF